MTRDTLERTQNCTPDPGPSRSGSQRRATLTLVVGPDVGAIYPLVGAITMLGRSPEAEVTIDDDRISRCHARIHSTDGTFEIEDLGSTNGTEVGGERITGRVALTDGARIQIGTTLLRFMLLDAREHEASTRIYEMSVRDGLTCVYNRRYFDERLTSEFAFAARHVTELSVLMVDIDHFKRVNDTFGHQAGDMVLRRVADLLRGSVRTEDVLARYGGEEFSVLARGIDVVGAGMFAERMRSVVERATMQWEGKTISVTLSIGVAHNHTSGTVDKGEQLVAAADAALYVAKERGRNRVEFARTAGRANSAAQGSSKKRPEQRSRDQATAPQDPSIQSLRPSQAPNADYAYKST